MFRSLVRGLGRGFGGRYVLILGVRGIGLGVGGRSRSGDFL